MKLRFKSELFWLVVIFAVSAVVFGSLIGAAQLTWDDDSNIFK